jgi:hypothetical protein
LDVIDSAYVVAVLPAARACPKIDAPEIGWEDG